MSKDWLAESAKQSEKRRCPYLRSQFSHGFRGKWTGERLDLGDSQRIVNLPWLRGYRSVAGPHSSKVVTPVRIWLPAPKVNLSTPRHLADGRYFQKLFPRIQFLRSKRRGNDQSPLGLGRRTSQCHARLFRQTIRFARIASYTRRHNIFPTRFTAHIARNDVIQIEFFFAKSATAVLALMSIA